jgi:excinuclease ABC subunit C
LPGVYLYRNRAGDVLYVGKAVSLRKRLATYLQAVRGRETLRVAAKVVEMAQQAASVEWIVTTGEVEALLLEHNLIKQHRPPFNIRLRDDKSYPYVMIALGEAYPRIMFTRQPHRKGNLYFGPYASAAAVRETLDTLGRVFPFRKCRGPRPGRHSGTPCLQYHIERCLGPCEGLVTPEEYREVVDQVSDFLSGRERRVEKKLEEEMAGASTARDFERAAHYRDRLAALRHVLEKQQVRSGLSGSTDVIGMARDEKRANVQVFLTREGVLTDRRSFTFEGIEGAEDAEVFERFMGDYYSSALVVPPEVVVPKNAGDPSQLALFLEGLRGTRVDVHQAERGEKRRLQELAQRNAELALEHERLRAERTREHRYAGLSSLQSVLGLERPPLRIEGYDISNLGPENTVASMVVMEGGAPRKSDYRMFTIRTTSGQDDVGAMREVLVRRFTRETGAAYDPSFESVPDLVMVDGGKPQLGAALAALDEVGLGASIPVLALAKREEEVFLPGAQRPLLLPRDDAGLLLLERLRDEAHRFALGFHRVRRRAATTDSVLDGLPGIGEKRKRAILRHFGSPEAFLHASREEIEAVPGLPGKVARRVHDLLHKAG